MRNKYKSKSLFLCVYCHIGHHFAFLHCTLEDDLSKLTQLQEYRLDEKINKFPV